MKKKSSTLQIIVFVACGVGVILAVLIFSDKLPIGKKSANQSVSGSVVMWGTLPAGAVKQSMAGLTTIYPDVRVDYQYHDQSVIRSDLVNALATGTGPDLITIAPSDVIADRDLILPIPYTSVPQSAYLAAFIDESAHFLTDAGIMAFPFVVDPMVMFYNKDLLTSAFTLNPPATWDDVSALNAKITKRDDAGTLSVQTAAMGTWANVRHAKEIMMTLIFQAGNKLVAYDATQKKYYSTFADVDRSGNSAIAGAINFYTSFANPANVPHYSWNAGLPSDRDQFIAGKLAIYFAPASELLDLRRRNPNLNFDIAMMPQRSASATKSTYGDITGIAIIKMSKNIQAAILIAQELVKAPTILAYQVADPTVSPARRDLLGTANADARITLINQSAIIAQSWLDPDPVQTSALFRKYVGDINAGAATAESILTPGNALLNSILSKIKPAAAPEGAAMITP